MDSSGKTLAVRSQCCQSTIATALDTAAHFLHVIRYISRSKLLLTLPLIFALAKSIAQPPARPCNPPDAAKIEEVRKYLEARDHIVDRGNIRLVEKSVTGEECFWRLEFAVPDSAKKLVAFLSPNMKYISSDLLDLAEDPLAVERARSAEIKRLLSSESAAALGPADARVTIVEFSDFQCPYCKKFAEMLRVATALEQYKGNVRIVYRQYPLSIHPWAGIAARMSQCVALQDTNSFWLLHDFLFENQRLITTATAEAQILGFVTSQLPAHDVIEACYRNGGAAESLGEDQRIARQLGVRATPTVFINGAKYQGFKSAEDLTRAIDVAILESKDHAASLTR